MSADREIRRSLPDELERLVQERTPARLLVGRAGQAYTSATQLQLRADHAAARDAIWREFDLLQDLGEELTVRWHIFEVRTHARSKSEYLLNPRLGRDLPVEARNEILHRCAPNSDLQIVIGDGLSATAVAAQVPSLLPLLMSEAERRGWTLGQPFAVRYCRVGVLNAIGELLRPSVVVLLIGERPGMSTAESLSAYMAYKPDASHTDANRNLISNIQARGIQPHEGAVRVAELAAKMMRTRRSGSEIGIMED
jgi:ethanolamine ammonia-lyase small subunit